MILFRGHLEGQLENWDKLEEKIQLTQVEIEVSRGVKKKLWEVNHMEEISWRQKSRALWFKGVKIRNSCIERQTLEEG